ncbi:hypothetical protein E4U42_001826 [Claviceps africana]|uniref:Kinetochore protein fta7 n=1 Tax=Claviceps africana TaxID=83212 RepID=A0A8K0NED6_9HYPO|nr:hypothetical protein E4U42_001826 [Claviceps africana]
MASIPPPNRKRGQPSNAAKKRKSSGGGGRQSMQSSSNGQAGQRKQLSIRESWGAPGRRRETRGEAEDDDDDDDDDEEEREDDDESAGARKRGRASDAGAQRSSLGGAGVIGRRGIPQPNQPRPQQQKQQQQQQQKQHPPGQRDRDASRDASSAPPSPPKPYVHVAPYTRRVRQSAIEAKWSPLANASLTAVSTTLQDAQRPVLQRISDSQLRREHTASALRLIAHRVTRKISRGLPFPPASMPANVGRAPLQSDGGREVELNFESVLDGKGTLERQLEPALDGLEVLRREKEALEGELELDYETLRNLEAGARAQAREQRSLLRRAHVLAPAAANANANANAEAEGSSRPHGAGFEWTKDEDAARGGAFTDILHDDDIQPLSVQLGTHVDNIRANLEQTDHLTPQLARSRAALRAVLLRHLDLRQYEQVVLG